MSEKEESISQTFKMGYTLHRPWSDILFETTLPPTILEKMVKISDKVLADSKKINWGNNLAGQIKEEVLIPLELLEKNNLTNFFGNMVREYIHQCNLQKTPPDQNQNMENIKNTAKKLTKKNHQYWNCMWAEFKRNVENHHDRGWENMTKEYYDSLEPMTDDDIRVALVDDPVKFFGGFLKHGYHRAVSMIGRLINGKEYIPFYMPAGEVFKGNVENPLKYINYIELMDVMGFPKQEYAICNSAILAVMGVDARKNKNGDLDLVFSSKLRKMIEEQNIELPKEIHPFPPNSDKFRFFGCEDDDDLVYNYSVDIHGYNFAQPRFYFSRMHMVKPSAHRSLEENRKIKQEGKDGVDKFIEMKSYQGYPFDLITEEEWGFDLIQEVE